MGRIYPRSRASNGFFLATRAAERASRPTGRCREKPQTKKVATCSRGGAACRDPEKYRKKGSTTLFLRTLVFVEFFWILQFWRHRPAFPGLSARGRAFYSAPSTAPAPIMTRLRWRVPRRLPSQKVLVVHSKVPQHPAHIAKLKAPGLSVSRWHFPKMLLPWRCTARITRI